MIPSVRTRHTPVLAFKSTLQTCMFKAWRSPVPYLAAFWLTATMTPPSLASDTPVKVDASTSADVRTAFPRDGRLVLTFLGYSAAGYEDERAMIAKASAILNEYPVATTIVNIGATSDGIGAIYELARRRGYYTTGIVSSKAKDDNVPLSKHVEMVIYVKDDTWGGVLPGTRMLSPTSRAIVDNSDVMVAIGGGAIARDEVQAAHAEGKSVRYIAADMNHAIAIERARKAGSPAPTDFSSAVGAVLRSER